MSHVTRMPLFAIATLLSLGCADAARAQQANMTFFIISAGPGKGRISAASRAQIGNARPLRRRLDRQQTWRAYLSTSARAGRRL